MSPARTLCAVAWIMGCARAYTVDWCHQSSATVFTSKGVSVGQQLNTGTGPANSFTLNSHQPFATLDYGVERAGIPFFNVSHVESPVQIEIKYAEQFDALDHPWSDGPYSFVNGLSNTFRVETYNVTAAGGFQAAQLQGGQRWQSIKLLNGTSITFSCIGFQATASTIDTDDLPGKFQSDDETLNSIWKLGAVAASAACLEKGSQPSVWKVDPINGAYITSLRPSQSLAALHLANYTLEFDTFIDRGGVWWSTVAPLGSGAGIQLLLVGEQPVASTYVNTNKTLFPPNSILLSYGWDFVNQTTLKSYLLDTFAVAFQVKEKTWHHLAMELLPSGNLSVSLDGQKIFNTQMSKYYTGAGGPSYGISSTFTGTFGFGAWQDQAVYIRNVRATAANGTVVYSNPMTSSGILAEFGTGPNIASVCLDGAKRDRLVWLGDFYHTSRIVGVSTGRYDLARSTLSFLLSLQIADGELPISPSMSYSLSLSEVTPPYGTFGLFDYQLLGMGALHSYVRYSNDLEFVKSTWSGWKKQLDWAISLFNVTGDDLWYAPSALLGPTEGSALSCLALQSLRQLAEIAEAIGDNSTKEKCAATADILQSAINTKLWNNKAGFYALSPSVLDSFSVAGTAFCISSGAASREQSQKLLSSLQQLSLGPGFKDNSDANASDPSLTISPNTNGFLLESLHMAGGYWAGYKLIRSLWGAMVSDPRTSSGASWEYVDVKGGPGLGLFTSLAHPWGGAATYILTEWYAGIQPAKGVEGYGYNKWVINPEAGVNAGLRRMNAKVPTPGGSLSVEWHLVQQQLRVEIHAPKGTSGLFIFRGSSKELSGGTVYKFSLRIG